MRRSPDERTFAWVLGTGRCGSTLVHEILARHPATAFISNLEDNAPWFPWSGRFNGALFRQVPNRLTEKGRIRFAPSESYRLLERQVSPVLSTPMRDLTRDDATPWLGRRFGDFFEARARAQSSPVFLHKFTGWPRAGFIEAAVPASRFVHIVRDGRAVANSWLQMSWWRGYGGPAQWQWGPLPADYADEWDAAGRSFPVLAGIAWKMLMDAFGSARSALGPERWLEMRYEDVVAQPRERFEEILGFLGLPRDRRFDKALGRYEFSTERHRSFERDLDERSVKELEECLDGYLHRFGYLRTT